MVSTGRNFLSIDGLFRGPVPEMPFAHAHKSGRRAPAPRLDAHGRVAILGETLPITGSEWRARELQKSSNHDGGADHLPSMTLRPSHTAPTKPVTIMVITALNV